MCRAEQRGKSRLPDECDDDANSINSADEQPHRRRKPPQESRRRMFWRTLWVILNNLYSIPAYILVMCVLKPLRHYFPRMYWFMEGHLCKWMYGIVASWLWSAGYTVTEVGDDTSICQEDETLVMVNHQSTGDVPVVMNLLLGQGSAAYRTMWILDSMFKYTSFGLVSQVRGDFFITQGKEGRQRQLENLRRHLRTVYPDTGKKWIILFPEGGFLYKRKIKSQEYGRKNGYPILEHATLPRIGAIQTILQTLLPKSEANSSPVDSRTDDTQQSGSNTEPEVPKTAQLPKGKTKPLKYVIDATIAYPAGKPLNLLSIGMGTREPCATTIHYRVFLASDLPQDTDGLTKWMYDRYQEKDQMLGYFYKTGKFCMPDMIPEEKDQDQGNNDQAAEQPSSSEPAPAEERPLGINSFYLFCVHVFFLALTWYIGKNIFYLFSWMLGLFSW